jgi:hypothetical protein
VKRVEESLLFKSCCDTIVGPDFRAGYSGPRNCGRENGVLGGILETRIVDIGVNLTNKFITVVN